MSKKILNKMAVRKNSSVIKIGKQGVFREFTDTEENNNNDSNNKKHDERGATSLLKPDASRNVDDAGGASDDNSDDDNVNLNVKGSLLVDGVSVVTMDEDSKKILMTWVGRKVNVKNVRKSLKELVSLVGGLLPPGVIYSCCEQYDTYLNGGLYPVLHISTDKNVIQSKLDAKDFLPINAIGENNVVEQAVYTEIASITPPGVKSGNQSVFAVAAFRSIEEYVPEILVREWKSWTGSRGFMMDLLENGLICTNITFYIKDAPLDEPRSFFYVVTTEVEITEPGDEGLFVDLLQRFRVERFLGYRTIYRYFKSNT